MIGKLHKIRLGETNYDLTKVSGIHDSSKTLYHMINQKVYHVIQRNTCSQTSMCNLEIKLNGLKFLRSTRSVRHECFEFTDACMTTTCSIVTTAGL